MNHHHPSMAKTVAFTLVLALATSNAYGEPLCEDIQPSKPRQADLTCLERWIQTEQSWPRGAREQADAQLATLAPVAASLSEEAFYLRVAAIVALADNGHTNLSRAAIRNNFGLLPIRTYWFDDGLVIVRSTPEHRSLLGAKILEIAGHSPDALMATMQAYFGGTDECFRAYGHTTLFLSPRLLHAAGASPSPEALSILLETPTGERTTVDLATYVSEEPHPGGYTWRQLDPAPLPREGDGWVTWLGESGTDIPWAFDDADTTFRYRFLADEGVAHIQFRANISDQDADIGDFLDLIKRRLKADRPQHILWDQRQNGGGDLGLTADFSRQLHKRLPTKGKVYVLTSNATFSAGIYTAFFPEWTNDERTIVVGTRVGDRERFWAETGPPIVLPETEWRIFYSLQMHDLGQGCNDRERCHIRKSKWKVAVGSFAPEVEIPVLSTDLVAGRDKVVEWVLAEVGGTTSQK